MWQKIENRRELCEMVNDSFCVHLKSNLDYFSYFLTFTRSILVVDGMVIMVDFNRGLLLNSLKAMGKMGFS